MEKDATKKSFSHVTKVSRHRTDPDRLTIDGVLMIEEGCRVRGKKSFRQGQHPPINLKLVISEEDLHRLFSYALNSDSDFSGQVSIMLTDALQRIEPGARGQHKGHETDIFWIKTETAYLYLFFSYWVKKSLQDWPEYLQKLVNIASDEGKEYILKTSKGHYGAQEMAAYCIEKFHGEELKKLGLRPFDDPNNFYITYIHPSLKLSRELMKELKNSTIADSTIGPIFQFLKII